MAIRVTTVRSPGDSGTVFSMGNFWMAIATVEFTGEYLRGGERVRLESLFPAAPVEILAAIFSDAAGNALEYDRRNRTVQVFAAANRELAEREAYNAELTGDRDIQAIVLAK